MFPLIPRTPELERVTDADEEIFLLYTSLAGGEGMSDTPKGLGSVNSKIGQITVSLVIEPPADYIAPTIKSNRSRSKGLGGTRRAIVPSQTIEYVLEQDPSNLRSRTGDTGSVLWRASILLAELLLRDLLFPCPSSLFSASILNDARVIELGAGVGFLGILLTPYVHRYTMTDISEMVPLLRKNARQTIRVQGSPKLDVEELDWLQLLSAPPSRKSAAFALPPEGEGYDLLICCDCIYNTSLIPSLVHAIDYCSTPGKTIALIVAELREEEVLREFLFTWLNVNNGRWEIWRLPDQCFDARTAGWIAWKT